MTDSMRIKRNSSALKQAGIEATEYESRTLGIEELTALSITRLHSIEPLPGFSSETGQSAGDDPAILCLRPGEWLVLSKSLSPENLLQEMQEKAGSSEAVIYDSTHGLAVFRLMGKGAPWLLGKLSGLDYLAGSEAGPHCARTRMGHISVLVFFHRNDQGDGLFDLIFDRSYARYFWELLCESSAHADDLATAYGNAA